MPNDESRKQEPAGDPREAKVDAHEVTREDLLDTVTQSFHWLSEKTTTRLGRLKEQIEAKDAPPHSERILAGVLDVALAAGLAGVSEFFAGKLMGEVHGAAGEGKKEFVKAMFEDGVAHGAAAGYAKIRHSGQTAISGFIESQVEGVQETQRQNQKDWIQQGRHAIKSRDEAAAFDVAFSKSNLDLAADRQYDASRDAWVSYLAQSKYGSVEREHAGAEATETSATTDMRSQEARDRANRSAPGWIPADAPSMGAAALGHSPGVLSVFVELPAIQDGQVLGEPKVIKTYLNGANEAIRSAYANMALSEMRIPRHVRARVRGIQPNFELNIDERGQVAPIPHEKAVWLRARARAGHVEERLDLDDGVQRQIGERLLLEELVVNKVEDKGVG